MKFIPVNTPLLDGNEKNYLNQCLDTGWISSEGPFVKKFEEEFAKFVGVKHAVTVSNGTVALDIAVNALDLPSGSEVIVPAMTIISCASSVIQADLVPVFIDCTSDRFTIDVDLIEQQITAKTKAIMAVHLYGLPVAMEAIEYLANKYKLKIIEDAAQAHALKYKEKNCGSFGDLATFSFYPNKLITTGEGGMIVIDDDHLARRCQELRNLCFLPHKRFFHESLGTNGRMTNLQAALGLAQLEKVEQKIEKKRWIGKSYNQYLKNLKNARLPLTHIPEAQNIYWVYPLVLNDDYPMDAQAVMAQLQEKAVGTRPFFYPLHLQPALKKFLSSSQPDCPHSLKLYEKGFYIPSGLGLNEEEIMHVSKVLMEVVG